MRRKCYNYFSKFDKKIEPLQGSRRFFDQLAVKDPVKKSFAWTGEEVHPEIMVRAGDAEQLTPAEYIVSYDRTPVDAGEYEVRVTLKGHLRGTGTAAFRILPRGE